jgi:valyl-tRNA synthetase
MPSDLQAAVLSAIERYAPSLAGAEIVVDGTLQGGISGIVVEAPKTLLRERYQKDVARLHSEVERGEKKLENPQFVAKAAPGVIAKEREKLQGYKEELARVRAALAAMEVE